MSVAVSEAKLAANRANAQLSTGPTSEAGKAKVRLNAVKTGLTGRTVLLPCDDVAAYEDTIASFSEKWQPGTDEERKLVQSLADNDWRTQRIPSLEYGIFAEGACQFAEEFADETDPVVRRTRIQTKTFLTYHRQLMNLQSQESRLQRQREKDEARLQRLQGDRRYTEAKELQRKASIATQTAKTATAAPVKKVSYFNPGGFVFANKEEEDKARREWARKTVQAAIAEPLGPEFED